MHNLAYFAMKEFRDKYYFGGSVLEIGGAVGYGSVRSLFNGQYVTMDVSGDADIIVADMYKWHEINSNHFDYVISTSTLEHIEYPWLTMEECYRVLVPGGLVCHVAPSAGVEHKYPVDCYRYYPDGGRALLRWANFDVVNVYTHWTANCVDDGGNQFKDTVMIGQKNVK